MDFYFLIIENRLGEINKIMDIKQSFRVYCSTNFKELNKSLIENSFEEDDELILEGIASTTSIDEDGDYMTKSCLEDMKRQAIGLSVLKEHGRTLDDIIGKVISIPESDSDKFKIRFKILPKFKNYIMDFLDNDINLGLSIGARAKDYEPNEDSDGYGWKVNKAKLYEISLIPLPANWDSFGSVKVSKELSNSDDMIVAKCFNGACKQVVKEYSDNLTKEIEDAQKKDEEKYFTKKDALDYINEQGLEIYERVLSEVLDEAKKMIEKYHLNNNMNNNDSNESKNSNDKKNIDENSSKKKEDEEKEKSMKEEIDKKVETQETPDVQKNLEELERTSSEEEVEMNKEVKDNKVETPDADVNVSVAVDDVSNKDVLKTINEMKSFLEKSLDETVEKKVNERVEDMRETLRKEVEEELFKELTTERKPVETEQPAIEKEVEEEEEEEVNKAMNAHDIAKMLCS